MPAGWDGFLLIPMPRGGRVNGTGRCGCLPAIWTAIGPRRGGCRTPGCPTAARGFHGRCSSCRRARAAAGVAEEEFDRAPRRRPTRPVARGSCTVPDCGGELHCRGLCFRHERAWRKAGGGPRSHRAGSAADRYRAVPGRRLRPRTGNPARTVPVNSRYSTRPTISGWTHCARGLSAVRSSSGTATFLDGSTAVAT